MPQPPNSEPEPTRPTWKWLLAFGAAIVAIEMIDNWQDISAFAHLPQIGQSLGIG